jgi:signal transduction histidine kinase
MLVIAPTLLVVALLLAFFLRQQTVSQFVVYLSSQEQLERLESRDQVLLRFYASRMAAMMDGSDPDTIEHLVDIMASTVGRGIIVARNDERFYASSRLRGMELDLRVNTEGILVAHIEDDALGVRADLELAPVVTQEVTPFTVDEARASDVARVYAVPSLTVSPGQPERRFVSRTTRTIALLTAAAAIVFIALIGVVVGRSLRPIRRLTAAAHELRRGGTPEPVAVSGPREIDELASAFNEMATTVRETEESRRRLLGDISHELRGPLSNLRSQMEAIQDGLLAPSPRTLQSLHDETMLLTRLVDDLHELTLADMRSLRLDIEPTRPDELIRSAVDPLRAAFDAGDIHLEVSVHRDLPCVSADPQRIAQVIRNVLQNSLLYSNAANVTIRASHDGRHVRVEIVDTGTGVSTHEIDRIFDRFYRPDPSRARSSGGTGLGLAIARAIVEAHGGTIFALPNAPTGLIVVIRLPVASSGQSNPTNS